jgi:hypothetical protein
VDDPSFEAYHLRFLDTIYPFGTICTCPAVCPVNNLVHLTLTVGRNELGNIPAKLISLQRPLFESGSLGLLDLMFLMRPCNDNSIRIE